MEVLQSLALVFSQCIVTVVDTVSNVGLDLSAEAYVVNVPLRKVRQMAVSLGYLQEAFLRLLVARVSSRMVLEGQFLVSFLDIIQSGSSSQTQDFIVVLLFLGVVFGEEVFLVLLKDSLVLVEAVEDLVGIIKAVLRGGQNIVLVSPGRVGEVDVGLGDVIELPLRTHSIIRVFVRVELGR